MATTFSNILEEMEKLRKSIGEYTEKTLAEIITKYDFLVGSKELKGKLTEALPKAAKIIYSPYIEDPTVIYAIKKFEISSLFTTPYKPEEDTMNEQESKIIRIPKNATKGEVLKQIFPKLETRDRGGDFITFTLNGIVGSTVEKKWWDSPYEE